MYEQIVVGTDGSAGAQVYSYWPLPYSEWKASTGMPIASIRVRNSVAIGTNDGKLVSV